MLFMCHNACFKAHAAKGHGMGVDACALAHQHAAAHLLVHPMQKSMLQGAYQLQDNLPSAHSPAQHRTILLRVVQRRQAGVQCLQS